MTSPNGIYWTAIVFGESYGIVSQLGRCAVNASVRSVGVMTPVGVAQPPRIAKANVWMVGTATGLPESGPYTAIGVMHQSGSVTPRARAIGVEMPVGEAAGAALPKSENIYKPTVQRASNW